MIRANGLSRTYGSVVAVNNVSFEIGAREIVGLLGHNGAGKTTIMKMTTGYLEPSSGNITINGADVWSQRADVQRQIGYLPENCPLYPEMTVLDYLEYAAALRGVLPNKRLEKIGYVIEKTNLISVAKKSISMLSRGYKQRLGVAQAILNSPSIVILDEPTNGLDPSQIIEMRGLIRELSETATVVVSTHILQEVQAVCGRVIIINNGNLALDAPMADLQVSRKLRVVTDSEPAECSKILEQLPGFPITHSARKDDQYHYTVEPQACQISEAAALVASALVAHGRKIYALTPITQDLETLFAEISSGATVKTGPVAAVKPETVATGGLALAASVEVPVEVSVEVPVEAPIKAPVEKPDHSVLSTAVETNVSPGHDDESEQNGQNKNKKDCVLNDDDRPKGRNENTESREIIAASQRDGASNE